MSNDFINRRFYDKRRTANGGGGGGGSQFIEKELILLPSYDTFIFVGDNSAIPGSNRWNNIVPLGSSPATSQHLAVGLVNPWLDANDLPPPGQFGLEPMVRTPTRTFLNYDLTGITSGSQIISATLNLTTASSLNWIQPLQFRSVQQNPTEDITRNIWVVYNFDGAIQPTYFGYRAVSWGGDNPSFTWLKFVNGEYPFPNIDGYNPHPGRDHPWSIKAWYKWGARQFHLHMPFGRPYIISTPPPGTENYEHLSYQADAYLCAGEGLYDNGIFYNAPMPHLIVTFERIWRSLIEGKQYCTNEEWASLLEWFNPNEPIKVIVYNGTISKLPTETTKENQYPRWTRLFNENYDLALNRLKASVQPFINCGMQIALDALAIAPGSVPGQYIPTTALGESAQKGWWEFFTWLKETVGIENLYCEAHPEKRLNLLTGNLDPSPYLGLNVMAAEDWSYFPSTTATSFHKMYELGSVRYLRCPYWGNVGPKTRRVNPYLSPARYADLNEYGSKSQEDGEIRIDREDQSIYFGTAFEHIYAARNLKDRYDQEGDPRPEFNTTKPGYLMNPLCLQEYPAWGLPGTQRFIDRFPSIEFLKKYLDSYESPALITTT